MSLFDWIVTSSIILLVVVMIGTFIRIVVGPSLPDRVVSTDLLTMIIIGVIALYAILTNDPIILDVATVLALVTFLSTVAFAYYIDRRS